MCISFLNYAQYKFEALLAESSLYFFEHKIKGKSEFFLGYYKTWGYEKGLKSFKQGIKKEKKILKRKLRKIDPELVTRKIIIAL